MIKFSINFFLSNKGKLSLKTDIFVMYLNTFKAVPSDFDPCKRLNLISVSLINGIHCVYTLFICRNC